MSLIPNDCPKPDLFVYNGIDVTNYNIDDLNNLLTTQNINEVFIQCLYKSSNLDAPIIIKINFYKDSEGFAPYAYVGSQNITKDSIIYNNESYYRYDTMNIS